MTHFLHVLIDTLLVTGGVIAVGLMAMTVVIVVVGFMPARPLG